MVDHLKYNLADNQNETNPGFLEIIMNKNKKS